MAGLVFQKEVLRYPRLDTVLMIEKSVKDAGGDKTLRQIWLGLPKKVMWQTFLTTIDYLIYSGKILVDESKRVVWLWNPKLREYASKHGVEI